MDCYLQPKAAFGMAAFSREWAYLAKKELFCIARLFPYFAPLLCSVCPNYVCFCASTCLYPVPFSVLVELAMEARFSGSLNMLSRSTSNSKRSLSEADRII